MKTTASNLKVRQLIRAVQSEAIIPRPEFQRRLVWTNLDKNKFIDTVLAGYPFPEIYLANGEVDTATGEGKQLLVDGQQRVSTLVQYFEADLTLALTLVPSYSGLSDDEKRSFLDYDVAVRDLGNVSSEQIIEVFRRINATTYALNEIEINNAIYAGALKGFAEGLATHEFFEMHRIFRADDLRRMGDLRYVLQLIVTMLQGYFNRDDELEPALKAYNDEFPHSQDIAKRLIGTFTFIEECGFPNKSRAWKKNDLFTLIIELDRAHKERVDLQPGATLDRLTAFYREVDEGEMEALNPAAALYYKAAVQASNDKINRIRRGRILDKVLRGEDPVPVVAEIS